MAAATITEALADASAERRRDAYDAIEQAVREKDVAIVVSCVKPLVLSVLCAGTVVSVA